MRHDAEILLSEVANRLMVLDDVEPDHKGRHYVLLDPYMTREGIVSVTLAVDELTA
jgi:hypothetical protein